MLLGEEVAVNKEIVAREEDAKAGMRVLPAEDRFPRMPLLDLAVKVGLGLVRECQRSAAGERLHDDHLVLRHRKSPYRRGLELLRAPLCPAPWGSKHGVRP